MMESRRAAAGPRAPTRFHARKVNEVHGAPFSSDEYRGTREKETRRRRGPVKRRRAVGSNWGGGIVVLFREKGCFEKREEERGEEGKGCIF